MSEEEAQKLLLACLKDVDIPCDPGFCRLRYIQRRGEGEFPHTEVGFVYEKVAEHEFLEAQERQPSPNVTPVTGEPL